MAILRHVEATPGERASLPQASPRDAPRPGRRGRPEMPETEADADAEGVVANANLTRGALRRARRPRAVRPYSCPSRGFG